MKNLLLILLIIIFWSNVFMGSSMDPDDASTQADSIGESTTVGNSSFPPSTIGGESDVEPEQVPEQIENNVRIINCLRIRRCVGDCSIQ